MNRLKPHLIPILLIGAQIINTLLVYAHNNSILWFRVALLVMTISLIGLIRQFFPEEIDFSQVSAERVKEVQDLLNGRPRKVIDYWTFNEV